MVRMMVSPIEEVVPVERVLKMASMIRNQVTIIHPEEVANHLHIDAAIILEEMMVDTDHQEIIPMGLIMIIEKSEKWDVMAGWEEIDATTVIEMKETGIAETEIEEVMSMIWIEEKDGAIEIEVAEEEAAISIRALTQLTRADQAPLTITTVLVVVVEMDDAIDIDLDVVHIMVDQVVFHQAKTSKILVLSELKAYLKILLKSLSIYFLFDG
jgi:hypothetical protein